MEESKEFLKKLEDNKIWFCPLPFTHVFSSLSGRYAPCYDAPAKTGHNMEDTTIKEWYASDYQNNLRDQMTREDYNSEFLSHHCAGCWKQEQKYGRSDRMKYREQVLAGKFDNKVPELLRAVNKFLKDGKLIDIDERILDIKMKMFGNACNLDCYMCTPRSANTRIASLKKLERVFDPDLDPKDGDRMNTQKHDDEQYLDDVASVAQYTRSIKLIGGEPLVMINHYKLLDKLVQTGYSNGISLIYKTNLSVFNMEGYDFRNYFDHFKEFVMKISIDTYGEYNDYIRKKSDWDDLINNMMTMKARKNARVNVHSVISMLSVLTFYKLQEYLELEKIDHTYYILEYPKILHVKHLPVEIKEKLIPKYEKNSNIQKALAQEGDPAVFVQAIDYCLALDKNHNHNLFDLHPELKSHYEKAKQDILKENQ